MPGLLSRPTDAIRLVFTEREVGIPSSCHVGSKLGPLGIPTSRPPVFTQRGRKLPLLQGPGFGGGGGGRKRDAMEANTRERAEVREKGTMVIVPRAPWAPETRHAGRERVDSRVTAVLTRRVFTLASVRPSSSANGGNSAAVRAAGRVSERASFFPDAPAAGAYFQPGPGTRRTKARRKTRPS